MNNYEDMTKEELIKTLKEITSKPDIKTSPYEEKYYSLLNNIPDVVWTTDSNFNTIFINSNIEKIYGFTPEEIYRNKDLWLERIHPEDVKGVKEAFKNLFEKGIRFDIEYRIKKKDGTWIWLYDRALKTYKKDGISYADGLFSDITERKKIENDLVKSEKKYRQLIELAEEGLWVIDNSQITTFVNPKMAEILGYTVDEMIGKNPIAFLPEKEVDIYKNHIERRKKGIKERADLVFSHKKGQEIQTITSVSAITDDYGNYAGAIALVTDITDRKIAEKEKEKLQTQLAQSQKMESIGRMAGGVAHNFNNILGIILGCVELIQDEIDPKNPIIANLETIRRSVERSAQLTRQLLTFASKQSATPRVLDLNKTIEELLKMLLQILGEDIDIIWKPGANLEMVKIDPTQIDQILANLLLNAQEAIDGVGIVNIETDNAVFDETYCTLNEGFIPGEYVMLSISDNGCGMDRETLENIFEPFFTTKDFYKGTGLGMATVYGIVRQNNGFIKIYSTPDKGTTFKIYLPKYVDKPMRALEKTRGETAGGMETILIVEDELILLELAEAILKQSGYTVLSASTPEDAINLAGKYEGEIHLLIADVVMPGMNGVELAENFHSLYPEVKSLFMSGYMDNVISHYGVLDKGANFIRKPFSKKELSAKVREALEKK